MLQNKMYSLVHIEYWHSQSSVRCKRNIKQWEFNRNVSACDGFLLFMHLYSPAPSPSILMPSSYFGFFLKTMILWYTTKKSACVRRTCARMHSGIDTVKLLHFSAQSFARIAPWVKRRVDNIRGLQVQNQIDQLAHDVRL